MSINNQKGSSMIELIMVMTLLVLFGVTIYTLIYSGATTQERIIKEKDAQTDARIALSYINVRLRQNDSAGKIAVEKIDLTGKDAIVIKEHTMDYEYDTWIYSYEGRLLECLVDPGMQPNEPDSFYIVDIADLATTFDADTNTIINTVYYDYRESLKSISSTIYLHSN